MKIKILVSDDFIECSEFLNFTGVGFKDILKNNPEHLLEIIEEIECKFPEPKSRNTSANHSSH